MTARGIANWYAQTLGTIFTESPKPFEVEIVVAEVGLKADGDQICRITFDGSVTHERGFVAFGGQADQVSAALKEHYADGMSLSEAFAAALTALSAGGNGERTEFLASQPEVAVLDRVRDRRTFRRIRAARLEEIIREARPVPAVEPPADSSDSAPEAPSGPPDDSGPPTGPAPGSSDRGTGLGGGTRPPSGPPQSPLSPKPTLSPQPARRERKPERHRCPIDAVCASAVRAGCWRGCPSARGLRRWPGPVRGGSGRAR